MHGRQMGFTFRFAWSENGVTIDLEGEARCDDRGPRNSIAGAGRALAEDIGRVNFAFAGRPTTPARCRALVAEFNAAHGGP